MRRGLLAALAGAAALACAGAANATAYFDYTGTVLWGRDGAGIFGPAYTPGKPQGFLTGDTFEVRFDEGAGTGFVTIGGVTLNLDHTTSGGFNFLYLAQWGPICTSSCPPGFTVGFDTSYSKTSAIDGDDIIGGPGTGWLSIDGGATQAAFTVDHSEIPIPNPALDGTAVPEPAPWALLTLGLAGLGAVLRYRRQWGYGFTA